MRWTWLFDTRAGVVGVGTFVMTRQLHDARRVFVEEPEDGPTRL